MTEMRQAESWHESDSITLVVNLWKSIIVRIQEYTKETVEHLILGFIFYILVCIFLYLSIARWRLIHFKRDVKNSSRVLIVIAHPDDECMFFGPTVINFTKKDNCKVYLMCLSTGLIINCSEINSDL